METIKEIQEFLNELHEWQKITFPEATSLSKLYHLKEEISELKETIFSSAVLCPKNKLLALEYADCFTLLFGAAFKDGFTLKDILQAMKEKYDINKNRKWGNPDKNGVVKHI